MKLPHILLGGCAMALASCGSEGGDSGAYNSTEENTAAENGAGMTPAAAAMGAQDFVNTIAGSDMFEIESGKLAKEKAQAADLKSFGAMLVTDHTKSSNDLKAAAAKASPAASVPAKMPPDMAAKLSALRGASGDAFDRLFVQQQTEGHRKALESLRGYASNGDQQALRDFAEAASPVVDGHLKKLEAHQ